MKFREYSKKIGFVAKFYEIDGYKHEWPFWDLCLQDALIRFFGKKKEKPLFDEKKIQKKLSSHLSQAINGLRFFDNISEQAEAKFVLKNSFKRAIQR